MFLSKRISKLRWYIKWHRQSSSNFLHFIFLAIFGVFLSGIIIAFINQTYGINTQVIKPRAYIAPAVIPTQENLKIAIFSDTGITNDTKTLLEMIHKENVDLAIIAGDLDHVNAPDSWRIMMEKYFGNSNGKIPAFISLGNHDMTLAEKYTDGIIKMIPDEANCSGNIPYKYSCNFRGLEIIVMSPVLAGTGYEEYANDILRRSDSIWRICTWHKNALELQTGKINDSSVNMELYDICREGGAIILNGHSHNYSRSFVFNSFKDMAFEKNNSPLEISKNKTFVLINALGGQKVVSKVGRQDIWAKIISKENKVKAGAVFCIFNAGNQIRKANCVFKDIENNILDQFEIINKL